MIDKPLIVFDFDGVIIDGLEEYWLSSRQACINLLSTKRKAIDFPKKIPQNFQAIRPWVHKGWEMVLLAAECINENSYLNQNGLNTFCQNYPESCKKALNDWQWKPNILQSALDNARNDAITNNLDHWLKCHKTFPGVLDRIQNFQLEGIEVIVLTTKSVTFTLKLLQSFNLPISVVFGHESGPKPLILKKLARSKTIKGFIEDRRMTLETIRKDPELNFLPCYLASWGYLKPEDLIDIPPEIKLLTLKTLHKPIKYWP